MQGMRGSAIYAREPDAIYLAGEPAPIRDYPTPVRPSHNEAPSPADAVSSSAGDGVGGLVLRILVAAVAIAIVRAMSEPSQ